MHKKEDRSNSNKIMPAALRRKKSFGLPVFDYMYFANCFMLFSWGNMEKTRNEGQCIPTLQSPMMHRHASPRCAALLRIRLNAPLFMLFPVR